MIQRCLVGYMIFLLIYFNLYLYKDNITLDTSYTCNYIRNSNINNNIYIYFSNFLENNRVLFIGVAYPFKKYKLFCNIFHNSVKSRCNISIKKLYNVRRGINLTYIALFVNYRLEKQYPTHIKFNSNIIPILNYKPNRIFNIILAIVNFHKINNYKQVIDVIEISKSYGVEHIVIYVTSSTLFIKSILFYYMKIKYVELIPFCFNKEINYVHETGQVEKINDILYRYMKYSKYIIFNDIDEIIISNKVHNILTFLKNVDNYSSDMYLFKSKLFPYFTKNYNSILKYTECCYIKRGYEKYIVTNLYKFSILDVHIFAKSNLPIKINNINESEGYVRHTRYNGGMCKINLNDKALNYFESFLLKKYKKFENMFKVTNNNYFYGKMT